MQMTIDKVYDWMPFWSPNGDQIIFQSNREGSENIWQVSTPTGFSKIAIKIKVKTRKLYRFAKWVFIQAAEEITGNEYD